MQPNPMQPAPRALGDDESAPDGFVVELCDEAVKRFREEIVDVAQRDLVREAQAQRRVVDALTAEFQQSAASRDWTIPERRVRQLAGDAIGLSLEYQHLHDYDPERAMAAAVLECLDGERARAIVAEQERCFAAETERAARELSGQGGER
jgi:hypothetical protein